MKDQKEYCGSNVLNNFRKAIKCFESKAFFARILNIKPAAILRIEKLLMNRKIRVIKAEMALDIEKATMGKVQRWELNPIAYPPYEYMDKKFNNRKKEDENE